MPLVTSYRHRARALALTATLAISACSGPEDNPLPERATPAALPEQVTLSGFSAGAYMAVQTHFALGETVGGVAAIAGGPYHCAQGEVARALGTCLSGDGIDTSALGAFAEAAAAAGAIAPLNALSEDRVWLFHSPADTVVQQRVGDALRQLYARYVKGTGIRYVADVASGHGWPTLTTGGACAETGNTYINACDYDAAGAALEHLYGELAAPATDVAAAGTLQEVALTPWVGENSGLSAQGLMYVPSTCEGEAPACRLHISFHGCQQGMEVLGDAFASGTGLNAWAATNRIVILYPQISKSLFNPLGCWDWWGYTGSDYDVRQGKQITAVAALIDAFGEGLLSVR